MLPLLHPKMINNPGPTSIGPFTFSAPKSGHCGLEYIMSECPMRIRPAHSLLCSIKWVFALLLDLGSFQIRTFLIWHTAFAMLVHHQEKCKALAHSGIHWLTMAYTWNPGKKKIQSARVARTCQRAMAQITLLANYFYKSSDPLFDLW